jgi:hypothetical protein
MSIFAVFCVIKPLKLHQTPISHSEVFPEDKEKA